MQKRIGVEKTGRIDSGGRIKIGSLFSNMRELPDASDFREAVSPDMLTVEKFMAEVAQRQADE